MRVVRAPEELDEALDAARREAAAAFGDDTVFCERYLERPRHVEIQLLADRHGNVAALGERDCSIQRRHQKVLEESPSPALDPELRARMSDAAVAFARAIGYESAGTAEFVLDGRDFLFLELNARIQVEHPVTELVTGVDIVREQLRIASGEALSNLVTDCYLRGHAVEVRLYAEDPRTFLPQAGRLERLRLPDGIRVDSGVREGDEIGTAYDPMIAKLIAAGDTREEAFDRLAQALRETEIGGVTTNLPFLRWLVSHPLVRAGRVTTAFLTENPPLSEPPAARRPSPGAARGGSTFPLRRRGRRPMSTLQPAQRRLRRARAVGDRRADARHGDPRPRRGGRDGVGATAARRARGDEDGDAARLAVRRDRARRARRRRRPRGRRRRARGAGRVVEVVRFVDAEGFFAEAEPLLLADEAGHNLILGIAGNVRDGFYPDFRLWLVRDGGAVVAAAMRTPPYNLILARPRSSEALAALAEALAEEDCRASSARSRRRGVRRPVVRLAGRSARTNMRQGVYALERVERPPAAAGSARVATQDDRDLVVRWWIAFVDEALHEGGPGREHAEENVDHRLSSPTAGILLWEEGSEVVSAAGWGGRTPNGIRIGPVYTPPELRGRGYATALTADLSQRLLDGRLFDGGRRFCFLYTDLANPTSNAIYERIGYRRVAESAEIVFG